MVVCGLLLGWFVLAVTVDRVLFAGSPGAALFWNPGSADANGRLADQLLQANPSQAALPAIRDRAVRALRRSR